MVALILYTDDCSLYMGGIAGNDMIGNCYYWWLDGMYYCRAGTVQIRIWWSANPADPFSLGRIEMVVLLHFNIRLVSARPGPPMVLPKLCADPMTHGKMSWHGTKFDQFLVYFLCVPYKNVMPSVCWVFRYHWTLLSDSSVRPQGNTRAVTQELRGGNPRTDGKEMPSGRLASNLDVGMAD